MDKKGLFRQALRMESTAVRVSVSEASRLFGVNARTIRRALQAQQLRYIVVRGRYKILFSSLVEWSQMQITVRRKRDRDGIGQWVDQWRIKNTLYSPRTPGGGKPEKEQRP